MLFCLQIFVFDAWEIINFNLLIVHFSFLFVIKHSFLKLHLDFGFNDFEHLVFLVKLQILMIALPALVWKLHYSFYRLVNYLLS